MIKTNILVIDDEASSKYGKNDRTPAYKSIEKSKIIGRTVSVDFATSLDDATSKINTGNYDLAIIDVLLPNWGDKEGEGFKSIVLDASKLMPVAIVSSGWDQSSMKYVRQVFQLDTSDIDIRLLFKWQEIADVETVKLVALQLDKELRRFHSLSDLNLSPSDSIKILHLSDLHIGSEKPTLTGANLRRVKDKIFERWPSGPDLIVVSGDISNTGHPDEYKKAEKWFQELSGLLSFSLPSNKLLLIPGNHDVNVALAASRQISINEDKSLNINSGSEYEESGLASYANAPFQQFARKVTKQAAFIDDFPLGHWVETSFIHHNILISGFNSSTNIKTDAWPKRFIDTNAIMAVEDVIKEKSSITSHDLFHISISHHCPVKSGKADEPIQNHTDYTTHLVETKAKPNVIFHGHEHSRDYHLYDGEILIVSAPTPTKKEDGRPPDTARGFNMLEIIREDLAVKSVKASSCSLEGTRWNYLEDKEFVFEKGVFRKSTPSER